MCDFQESVTTGQTHRHTDGQTDAGQSDPYVPLCFAGDTKSVSLKVLMDKVSFGLRIFICVLHIEFLCLN